MTKPVQQYHQNMVHVVRDAFDAAVDGNGAKELSPRLPAGSIITDCRVNLRKAFDGTTPVFTVGTNAPGYDNIMGSGDIAETTPGYYAAADLAILVSADTSVYANLSSSGSSTTEGAADILVYYVPDNSD